MLPKIQKILYATDLSDNAKYAAGYAALLADKLDAEITVLHVLDDLSWSSKNLIANYLSEEQLKEIQRHKVSKYKEMMQQRIKQFCEEAANETKKCQFLAERTLIREGNPAQEILDEAHEGDYDMVVIGTHGLGALATALLGNTARRVVRRCLKPVTVIRLPE
ncbi:universal stress protein [Desulfogranum marinum]|uniref:universal stress protein n=1 Tax=Desulfogranum marinum TaxID=453220 RepID=UPI001965F9A8|nr:universal stress protein [Desulfogranum marinum]MBM9514606.1 universal stress protein [Desulfogranum marinum]